MTVILGFNAFHAGSAACLLAIYEYLIVLKVREHQQKATSERTHHDKQ